MEGRMCDSETLQLLKRRNVLLSSCDSLPFRSMSDFAVESISPHLVEQLRTCLQWEDKDSSEEHILRTGRLCTPYGEIPAIESKGDVVAHHDVDASTGEYLKGSMLLLYLSGDGVFQYGQRSVTIAPGRLIRFDNSCAHAIRGGQSKRVALGPITTTGRHGRGGACGICCCPGQKAPCDCGAADRSYSGERVTPLRDLHLQLYETHINVLEEPPFYGSEAWELVMMIRDLDAKNAAEIQQEIETKCQHICSSVVYGKGYGKGYGKSYGKLSKTPRIRLMGVEGGGKGDGKGDGKGEMIPMCSYRGNLQDVPEDEKSKVSVVELIHEPCIVFKTYDYFEALSSSGHEECTAQLKLVTRVQSKISQCV